MPNKILKSLLLFTSQSFPLKLVSSASACHMKQRLWLKSPPPLKQGHLIPSPQPPPLEDYGYQIPPQRFQAHCIEQPLGYPQLIIKQDKTLINQLWVLLRYSFKMLLNRTCFLPYGVQCNCLKGSFQVTFNFVIVT